MVIIIIFLSLSLIYTFLARRYFVKIKKDFNSEGFVFAEAKVKNFILNNFYSSLVAVIVFSIMLSFVDLGINHNQSKYTGAVLTTITVVLFFLFLFWDIYKGRTVRKFQDEYQFDLSEKSYFKAPLYLAVLFNGIIAVEFILSIINIIIYTRS